jgi:hypothetical protein
MGFSGLPSLAYQRQGTEPLVWSEDFTDDEPRSCVEQKVGQVFIFGYRVNVGKLDSLRQKVSVAVGKTVSFSLGWRGSEFSLTLITPSKTVINAQTQETWIKHAKGANFEMYQVLEAEPGEWTLVIEPIDVPSPETVTWEVIQIPPFVNPRSSAQPATPTRMEYPTGWKSPTASTRVRGTAITTGSKTSSPSHPTANRSVKSS